MAKRKGFFARKLKALRREAGLSQPQLAEKAGISVTGLRQLEQGRRDPSYDTMRRLGQALGISSGIWFPEEESSRRPRSTSGW
jgi:transcriptional regulator with XRE-family HTH domain